MIGRGLAARGEAVVRGAALAALAVAGLFSLGWLTILAALPWLIGSAMYSQPGHVLWGAILVPALITVVCSLPTAVWLLPMPRKLARVTRQVVSSWTGITIASPYRSRPGLLGVLADPANWRDLLWLGVNGCGGLVVPLAPAGLTVTGIVGLSLVAGGQPGLYAAAPMPAQLAISAAMLAGGLWVAPACLRGYGRLAAVFLRPSKSTSLADRVRHLEQGLAQAVNAEAVEIGRIERGLRDEAQPRMAAMGKALKAAGQLVESDPAAARALLDSSARTLAELGTVVRGIRPAVLADRGLADAIRALALDAPVRVFADDGLCGRPPAAAESVGYLAVREVLASVVKGSGAWRVWIDVRHGDGMLRLGVTHDGTSPATVGGLHGVERLLAAVGGVVAVSPPGEMTTIAMEIPYAVADAPATAEAPRPAAQVPELACIRNPGVQDAFYVYENWTSRKAVLHRGECRFCNYGRGQRDSGETPNGKWHGPYVSEDVARSDSGVQATSRKRDCRRCMA
jgi:signal transduction histidine kinase